jgi:hypothetical protein
MFTLDVYTHDGKKKTYSVIDKDYAIFMFKSFMKALDLNNLDMIDGLTGEVLYSYSYKGWSVFDSQVISEKYMK